MSMYTVILEFDGGTYVSQHAARNEIAALKKWVGCPSNEMLAATGFKTKKATWISALNAELDRSYLVQLTGLTSVWCFSFLIKSKSGLVNIIKTSVK